MRTHRIAVIPGDGIGVEVVAAGLEVLRALEKIDDSLRFETSEYPWGSAYYQRHGVMMPPDGLATIRKVDAILFGAVGSREVPDHISLWGLRLAICQSFDQYANLRPTRILNGLSSPLRACAPADLDWAIVRENSEGEYAGMGGRAHTGLPIEVGTETAVFTRAGVERIMRFAFDLARSRPKKKLTVVTKSNAQRHGMVMWDEIARDVSHAYPDVAYERELVDAMAARMVLHPSSIDTLVATNLHADILSDLAAALSGSLGIAPTANLNPSRMFPSMFEPIHGSAFDIVGKGIANPIGTFWTIALMLDHLLEEAHAVRLMQVLDDVTGRGIRTPDLGGTARTADVTAAVCTALERAISTAR